jgi:ectoine hydroxylase-related dioxygenase (phytanoyl-CoA dioxygenase family)
MPFRLGQKTRVAAEQKQFWEDHGYLVLSGFFQPKEVQAVNAIVEQAKRNPSTLGDATVDVLHGPYLGKRLRGADAPSEVFQGPIKINDLFLDEPNVRHLALNPRLTEILSELLEGAPMVCNSLNFIWGSQQPDHFDTWYMPPPVRNKLAVSSICLEDVDPSAGPLVYYAGSHKMEPYKFSHGGVHAVDSEMPACRAYLEDQLALHKPARQVFLGKAGDVFLWHGQLLHGGTSISNPERTRKTLVTHYWRAQDVEPERVARVHKTGYYLKREHQAAAS